MSKMIYLAFYKNEKTGFKTPVQAFENEKEADAYCVAMTEASGTELFYYYREIPYEEKYEEKV